MLEKTYNLYALTPVHVGAGESITPEEYFLDDRCNPPLLGRFNPAAALAAMQPNDRETYLRILDSGRNLATALSKLRGAARSESSAVLYKVRVSPPALADLRGVLSNLDTRRGDVRPMPRSPYTGRILLPGSSIKGAIRTALLSTRAPHLLGQERWAVWSRRVRSLEDETGKKQKLRLSDLSDALQRDLFGAGRPADLIDRDPFRLLRVTDCEIAPDRAAISLARIYNQRGEATTTGGIRMLYERLTSAMEGAMSPLGKVTLSLVTSASRRGRLGKTKELAGGLDQLEKDCWEFYERRWNSEAEWFRWLYQVKQEWPDAGRLRIILRLGRFNHFESLSLDGLRRGWGYGGRPLFEHGTSRTACVLDDGKPAPFGWVVLEEA